MKKIIVTTIAFLSISNVNAEWTHVVCANTDGLERLVDESGSQVTISGQRVTDTNLIGNEVHYFSIAQPQHDLLKAACQASAGSSVPLPAYAINSRLAFFKVNSPNGGYSFEPRHYNAQRMRVLNHYFRSL